MNSLNPSSDNASISLTFDANGLIPVVAQDDATDAVLLLAYMNAAALERTLAEGILVFWSRSRQTLWRKGEQSSNTLRLRELRVNCEGNSLLARVTLEGAAACHEGYRSCYFRAVTPTPTGLTASVIAPRLFDPATVYHNNALTPTSQPSPQSTPTPISPAKDESPTSLADDARALYAAYERLRDDDLTATSNTSRLLHNPDPQTAIQTTLARARQELAELRGVLDGTHHHHGDERDVLLEASQINYWVTLAAVAAHIPFDAVRPDAIWLAGWNDSPTPSPSQELPVLRECIAILSEAAILCRRANVHPARVIAADLAAMRAKHTPSAP